MTAVAEDQLIDTIYDAAGGAVGWSAMLAELSDALNAGPANHTDLDCVTGHGFGSAVRTDEAVMHRYFADWATANPLLLVDNPAAFRARWRLRILHDDEMIDRRMLERSAYYNEFLCPIGAPHTIGIRLALRGTIVSSISIGRSARRGRFDAAEIALAGRMQPHLVRADRIRRQVQSAGASAAQLHCLLDRTDQPLLFVDGFGRVQACSDAAAALLDVPGPLRLGSGGRLQAGDVADGIALYRLIGAALSGGEPGRADTIEVGTGGGLRVRVTVNRVRARDLPALGSDAVMLVSLERIVGTPDATRRLHDAFGLTPAEARVALALVAGDDLRMIGIRHGCSINTVRTQLASIFAKTRCHRQIDLVRMLTAAGFAPL